MMLWGAWTTGISFDEPFHVQRLDNFFEHGWYLIDAHLDDGQPSPSTEGTYVYAPVAALLAHALTVISGNESPGQVVGSAEATAVRHLTMALIAMVGIAACAAITRLLSGSWRWGLVAAGLLVAMPSWTGHAMFNIKDIPVATGYTLVTLGVMLLHLGNAQMGRRLVGALLVCGGTVLAVGTRPGIWPGLAAAGGVILLVTLLQRRWRPAAVLAGLLLASAVVCWVVLAAVYPAGFLNVEWILGSVSSSASYGGRGSPLYVPRTALIEIPTVVLLTVLTSVCVWLVSTRNSTSDADRRGLLLVVAAQCLLVPALATAGGSTFYDGLRQVLFIYPAIAVLVTLLVRAVLHLARPGPSRLLAAMVLVSLALPTVVQARLFPYNYAFTSELGAAAGVPSRGDYWRTSLRELVPRIPEGEHLTCTPVLAADDAYLRYSPLAYPLAARANDCRRDPISPVAPYLGTSSPATYPLDSFLEVSTELFPETTNCDVLAEVTRTPYFSEQRISEVSRCDLALRPYPDGGLDLEDPDQDPTSFLLGEWTDRPDRPGLEVLGESGALGFTLEPGALSGGVDLVHASTGDGAAAVSVNGQPVTSSQVGDGRWQARVPGSVADALGDGRVVVSWAPQDAEWSLLSVSVTPR